MRGSPISRSSRGRSPLPQGSRITPALTPRSVVSDHRVRGMLQSKRGPAAGIIGYGVISVPVF
jgi:hypothetical protein